MTCWDLTIIKPTENNNKAAEAAIILSCPWGSSPSRWSAVPAVQPAGDITHTGWVSSLQVSLFISHSSLCSNWSLNQGLCDFVHIFCLKICFPSLKWWQESLIVWQRPVSHVIILCEFSSFLLGFSRTSVHGGPIISPKTMASKYTSPNFFPLRLPLLPLMDFFFWILSLGISCSQLIALFCISLLSLNLIYQLLNLIFKKMFLEPLRWGGI